MFQDFATIKQALSNNLVDDIVIQIQYKYYELKYLVVMDVLLILDKWFDYTESGDKYYINGYKHGNRNYTYFNHPLNSLCEYHRYLYSSNYITIEYGPVYSDPSRKREKNIYGFTINRPSGFHDSVFDRLKSRLINNTCFYAVKSRKQVIILCYE